MMAVLVASTYFVFFNTCADSVIIKILNHNIGRTEDAIDNFCTI